MNYHEEPGDLEHSEYRRWLTMAESTLPQGRELDALVAGKVMGLEVAYDMWIGEDVRYRSAEDRGWLIVVPHYSSSIAAAWPVKAEMIRRGYSCVVEHEQGRVTTTFFGPEKTCGSSCTMDGNTEADEARCIVSAALDALHNAGEATA